METRAKEFAWVAKLSGSNKLVKWAGKSDGTLEQVVLKMAVLGPGAKEDERNIVEVTTFDSEQSKIKACICSLSAGKTENLQLADISLYPPAHLNLVEGNGPVHIIANHMVLDDDDLSDEEDISDYDEEMEKIASKLQSKKNIGGKGDAPKKGGDEESDDDLDEDLSGDDFLDMEAAEEESDEEDEDIEEKPVKIVSNKRKLANGDSNSTKKNENPAKKMKSLETPKLSKQEQKTPKSKKNGVPQFSSPEKGKQQKPEQKTPKSENTDSGVKTPKSAKKTPSKPSFTSVEEVKAAIKKLPGGKPRKQEKFCNWLENQFKVSTDSWKSELWMWHKKEQGL